MNPKRHAELERKLTLTPVPKPPAGLLDRIKNDIPQYLRPEAANERASRSFAYNLRVAAAVMVVISSVVATVYLLEPEQQLAHKAVKAPVPAAVATPYVTADEKTDEVRVEITQQAPPAAPPVQMARAASATSSVAVPLREDARHEEALSEPAGATTPAAPLAVAELDAAGIAPPPPPAAAPAPAPAAADRLTITAEAPVVQPRPAAKFKTGSLVAEAQAADLELGPRANVFGISVDPSVFHHIRETLEKNQRPDAARVDVEALVNYFAGAPSRRVRRGVRLEAEGSPSPVSGTAQHGFLRFTIDTASLPSSVPVASDARLEIELNGKVVERAQPAGDAPVSGPEPVLLTNLSVTGLYELTLRPNVQASARIATVRLTYTDTEDGKRRTIEKTVYARDFGKPWTRATHRHRLASLGAVWGQSLKGSAQGPEVARRAEELASQEPDDERAQELATAATASSKLNSGF